MRFNRLFASALFPPCLLLITAGWLWLPAMAVKLPPPSRKSVPADCRPLDARFAECTLPPGSALLVILQTPLDTSINEPQDPVDAITDHNLYLQTPYLKNGLLLSRNAHLKGSIRVLEKPIEGRDAILGVHFHEIILDNGEKLPIDAHVRTDRHNGLWGGGLTQGTRPVLSTQHVWGIGDYKRTVFAGPRAMGEDIRIPPGEHWILILDEALVLVKERNPD